MKINLRVYLFPKIEKIHYGGVNKHIAVKDFVVDINTPIKLKNFLRGVIEYEPRRFCSFDPQKIGNYDTVSNTVYATVNLDSDEPEYLEKLAQKGWKFN